MLYSQGISSRVLPIHQIADIISVLSAVHALTDSDSTSKIGDKRLL